MVDRVSKRQANSQMIFGIVIFLSHHTNQATSESSIRTDVNPSTVKNSKKSRELSLIATPSDKAWDDHYYHELIHHEAGLSGAEPDDYFGSAVALSGDGTKLAIGSRGMTNGSVFVFKEDNAIPGGWKDIGMLIDTGIGDYGALDMNDEGNMLVIGNPNSHNGKGSATVYRQEGNEWLKFGNEIVGTLDNGGNGHSVAISGSGFAVACGAPNAVGGLGRVTIHEWNSQGWIPSGDNGHTIDGTAGSFLGGSIALNYAGDRIVIGEKQMSPIIDGKAFDLAGGVSVYDLVGRSWKQVGNTLTGSKEFAQFGNDVDISWSGNRIVIGAYKVEDESSTVTIYEENESMWSLVGDVLYGEKSEKLGPSVRISGDGNVVASSAAKNDNGDHISKVKLFRYVASQKEWEEIKNNDSVAPKNLFGDAIALDTDGGRFAIGVESQNSHRGAIHVFKPVQTGVRVVNPAPTPSPQLISPNDSAGNALGSIGILSVVIGVLFAIAAAAWLALIIIQRRRRAAIHKRQPANIMSYLDDFDDNAKVTPRGGVEIETVEDLFGPTFGRGPSNEYQKAAELVQNWRRRPSSARPASAVSAASNVPRNKPPRRPPTSPNRNVSLDDELAEVMDEYKKYGKDALDDDGLSFADSNALPEDDDSHLSFGDESNAYTYGTKWYGGDYDERKIV